MVNGLLLVMLSRNWQRVNMVSSFLPFLYTFLTPVHYPLERLPVYLQLAVYVIPLTPPVTAMKRLLNGDIDTVNIALSLLYAPYSQR